MRAVRSGEHLLPAGAGEWGGRGVDRSVAQLPAGPQRSLAGCGSDAVSRGAPIATGVEEEPPVPALHERRTLDDAVLPSLVGVHERDRSSAHMESVRGELLGQDLRRVTSRHPFDLPHQPGSTVAAHDRAGIDRSAEVAPAGHAERLAGERSGRARRRGHRHAAAPGPLRDGVVEDPAIAAPQHRRCPGAARLRPLGKAGGARVLGASESARSGPVSIWMLPPTEFVA